MSALRFSSTAVMPQRMRERVEAQGRAREPATAADGGTGAAPRKQRRDEEHEAQKQLFKQIQDLAKCDARYALAARRTYAIPNGGKRSKRDAGRLKAEGVLAGVADVFCSLPAGDHHGLYIEMKSLTGSASREQNCWIIESIELGYSAAVCRGAHMAFKVWQEYVSLEF